MMKNKLGKAEQIFRKKSISKIPGEYTPTEIRISNKHQALQNLEGKDLLKGKTVKKELVDKNGNPYLVNTWIYHKK
jgi:hypothetical protein